MKIKNWADFQHFKDRTPPWIKLHRTILERRDINLISDCSFRVLVGLWLLASEDKDMEGNLPPVEEVAFRLRMDESIVFNALHELKDFLILDDNELISERYQDDVPETETETEKRRDIKPSVERQASDCGNKPNTSIVDVQAVFEHWQAVMNHPQAKLDTKRERKVRDRLKDGYTVEHLCQAIDGCKNSPHHMGDNDRATVYDDLELICRDASHVDKFIKLATSPSAPVSLSGAGRQTALAAQEWLQEGSS